MVYSIEDDFFNAYKTRNCENTDEDDYNCAGYALNTFSWYTPFKGDSDEEMLNIHCLIEDGMSKEAIYELKLEEYSLKMLSDFPNLRLLTSPTDVKENERLIYFKIFYEVYSIDFLDFLGMEEEDYNDGDEIHMDFHYRFYEDGHWHEKCGSTYLRTCDNEMTSVWDCGCNQYDSRTVYFALEV